VLEWPLANSSLMPGLGRLWASRYRFPYSHCEVIGFFSAMKS
jgi:hypothetical protein